MVTRLSSLLRSKRGLAAVLTGVLFALLVYSLSSGLGPQVDVVADYVGPIVGSLETAPGILLGVAAAVIFVLLGLRTRRPNGRRGRAAPPLEFLRERKQLKSALQEGNRKHQQLRSQLRVSERELERLKAALQEGEREREQLESENERLRAENAALGEKVSVYDKRVTLKQALDATYRDGLQLRGGTTTRRTVNGGRRTSRRRTFDDEAATKWAIRTSELIKEALGESASRRFLGADSQKLSGDPSTTEEQKRIDGRLFRLSELIQQVDSLQPLELQDGFKDQDRIPSR